MITITIKTENAAFEDGNKNAEVARILREIAFRLDEMDNYVTMRVNDSNGNTVCKVKED